jgi:hypothetical protein
MNHRQVTPQVEVSDVVFQSPEFRLVPLHVANQIRPDRHRIFPPEYLDLLHQGSYVKVLAASVADIGIREEIWLRIQFLSPIRKTGKHVGMVVPPAKKQAGPQEPAPMAKWHGLEPGMLIYFQLPDVIDMQLNRTETS